MTAVIDVAHSSFAATVLAGALPVPLPEVEPEASLNIIVPDFSCDLSTTLSELTSVVNSNTVIAKAVIDKDVNATLALTGKLTEGGTIFQIKETSFRIKPSKELARADFVASTLSALIALAQEVQLEIPAAELDLRVSFDLSPLEISKLLQARQTDYRLMVIERATGTLFLLPSEFSSSDMAAIIFTYRAIADRSFYWRFEGYPLRVRASEEGLNHIIAVSRSPSITLNIAREKISVLGNPIFLGDTTVTVCDPIVDRFDRVKEELARLDDHEVEVLVRSNTGQARFELADAPRAYLIMHGARIFSYWLIWNHNLMLVSLSVITPLPLQHWLASRKRKKRQ